MIHNDGQGDGEGRASCLAEKLTADMYVSCPSKHEGRSDCLKFHERRWRSTGTNGVDTPTPAIPSIRYNHLPWNNQFAMLQGRGLPQGEHGRVYLYKCEHRQTARCTGPSSKPSFLAHILTSDGRPTSKTLFPFLNSLSDGILLRLISSALWLMTGSICMLATATTVSPFP